MTVRVSFDGVDLGSSFAVGEQRRPLPEFRAASTVIDGADGEAFDDLTVGVRECSMRLTALDRSPVELQRAARSLAGLFAVRRPAPLRISDEVDSYGTQLTRYAVPVGSFDADEFVRTASWVVTFRSHDPFLYGRPRSVVLRASGRITVDAGGNAVAYPRVTLMPPAGWDGYASMRIWRGPEVALRPASRFGGGPIEVDMASLSFSSFETCGLVPGSRFFGLSGRQVLCSSVPATVSWVERWV